MQISLFRFFFQDHSFGYRSAGFQISLYVLRSLCDIECDSDIFFFFFPFLRQLSLSLPSFYLPAASLWQPYMQFF